MPRTATATARVDVEIDPPPLHAGQRKIAADRSRFRIAVCGRRFGKTRLGVFLAIDCALKGGRVWWVAPVYKQSNIAWNLCLPMVADLPGVEVRKADKEIWFPGGGSIAFKSADNSRNLRGEGLDFLIIDEADFLDASVWEQVLRPALADRKGGALIVSTPNVEDGWFHRLFQRGQRGEPGWKSWQLPSSANPYLDPAEIDEARQTLPPLIFQREFEAKFVSLSGARIKREWLRYGRPESPLPLTMGVDLAISTKSSADYTAAAVITRVPKGHPDEGRIYVVDVVRVQKDFHGVLEFVKHMAQKHKPRTIAIEQVQYQAAVVQELLRTTTLPVRGVKPDRDKLTRFQPLEARYAQALVYHAPGLPAEFEGELLGFPVSAHDDQVDALAYAYAALGNVAPAYDSRFDDELPRSRV